MNNYSRERLLVVLYGTLEYDGRVKRLIEILNKFGNTFLIDKVDKIKGSQSIDSSSRKQVELLPKSSVVIKHLHFWVQVLLVARRYKPNIIVGADFFTTIPAWVASRVVDAKLIYDAHELIIPEPEKSMKLRDYIWYRFEKIAVKKADLVIAANEDRARLMQLHYGLKQTPTVMRNIPPEKNFNNIKDSILEYYPQLKRRYPEERVVLYQGDVSIERGLDRFVNSLKYLPEEYRLVIAGGGPDLQKIYEIGSSYEKSGRLTILGRIENQLMSEVASQADIGIVTYPFQGQNNIYCAPNKIFEYAQSGLPIVATDQPPLRSLVEIYNIGELVCEHNDAKQTAIIIQNVINNKYNYIKNIKCFLEKNRWEDEVEKVSHAISNIVN